jgi:Na+/melibiose symporter-like transporter
MLKLTTYKIWEEFWSSFCWSQSGFREDRNRRRGRHIPGGEINTNTKTRIPPKFCKLLVSTYLYNWFVLIFHLLWFYILFVLFWLYDSVLFYHVDHVSKWNDSLMKYTLTQLSTPLDYSELYWKLWNKLLAKFIYLFTFYHVVDQNAYLRSRQPLI